jgi:hypothetical protein
MLKPNTLLIGLIIPIAMGLLGFIGSVYGPIFLEKHKELSYVTTDSFPAVNAFIANHDVKVMVGGMAVKNLRSYQVVIENTGKLAIDETDFKSPIQILFPMHKVVGQPIVLTEPSGVAFKIESRDTNNSSSIYLSPGLMNEKDSFRLSILLDGETVPAPVVTARITGVKAILLKDTNTEDSDFRNIYSPWFAKPFFIFGVLLSGFMVGRFLGLATLRPWWIVSLMFLVPAAIVVPNTLMHLVLPLSISQNSVLSTLCFFTAFFPPYVLAFFWGEVSLWISKPPTA